MKKKRASRCGGKSIARNRARNWQVRYIDPDGKRRVGGTFRDGRNSDTDLQLAKILAIKENGTWRLPDDTMSVNLNPKAITLR